MSSSSEVSSSKVRMTLSPSNPFDKTPRHFPLSSSSTTNRCNQVAHITLSLFVFAIATVFTVFSDSICESGSLANRIIRVIAPFTVGAAFSTFLSALLPSKGVHTLRTELVCLGFLIYFLSTEAYLNDGNVKIDKTLMDGIMGTFGAQTAARVQHTLEKKRLIVEDEEVTALLEGAETLEGRQSPRYNLLTDKLLWLRVSYRALIVLGGVVGVFSSKSYKEDFKYLTGYYAAQIISLLLMRRLIQWGGAQEEKYAEGSTNLTVYSPPKTLRGWRFYKKWFPLVASPIIGLSLYYINPMTACVAGAIHTSREEIKCNSFSREEKKIENWNHAPCSGVNAVYTAYRVTRYVILEGVFVYFTVEIFKPGTPPLVKYAWGTFMVGAHAGLAIKSLLVKLYKYYKDSPIADDLYYYARHSTEDVPGMNALYPYIVSLHSRIGSEYLSGALNLQRGLDVGIPWGGYGLSMLSDMVRGDLNEIDDKWSEWQTVNYVVSALQLLSGRVV